MENEKERLKALHNCHILDTAAEKKYDDIVLLASQISEAPIALISLVDTNRQWFKSKVGLEAPQTERNISFCTHTIQIPSQPMIINDALKDSRFTNNPLVLDNPNIRFYAGFPLIVSGQAIGTLCIIDTVPRTLNDFQIDTLGILARNIAHLIESDIALIEKNNLQFAMQTALKGIAHLNLEGDIVEINKKLADKFGYSQSDLVGKNIHDLFLKQETLQDIPLVKNSLLSEQNNIEITGIKKDKTHIPLNMTLVAKHNHHKEFIGFYCFVQNITERKRIEQELNNAKNFQELILNNIPDYIFVKDKDFRILQANNTFFNLYPPEQKEHIIGTTTAEEFNKDEADAFLKNDKIAFSTGKSEVYETLNFPDGNKRTLFTTKVRFENTAKEPFILGIARDVTERDKLINKLKESNDALNEFAYIASHDLKEPIRGINNHIHLLKNMLGKDLPEKAQHRFERIDYLIHYIQNLITDLLHFSKLGNIELAWQETDLNALLDTLLPSLKMINSENITININKLPTIYCDKIRIQEVFRNLITNAIKYNDKTHKIIEVGLKNNDQKNINAHILYVKDNGIGIDKEYQDVVFQIFKRLHAKEDFEGGNGTGLTFVKKIIERHNGKIWLESEPNKGTIFYLKIPFNR